LLCSADLVGRNREGTEKLSLLCFQLRCCSVLVVLGAESSNQMMLLFIQDEEAAQRSKAKQSKAVELEGMAANGSRLPIDQLF
jgi:hypothetical protein